MQNILFSLKLFSGHFKGNRSLHVRLYEVLYQTYKDGLSFFVTALEIITYIAYGLSHILNLQAYTFGLMLS